MRKNQSSRFNDKNVFRHAAPQVWNTLTDEH